MRLIGPLATVLIACAAAAWAQPRDDNHKAHHGGTVLFVAQADAAKAVPASGSAATATGAFQINRQRGTFAYEVTYQGLERGRPKSIGLYNFGAGANGGLIHLICGEGGPACPDTPFGNLTGAWEPGGLIKLDNNLLSEFASARVYLQVVGADGRPEIRGQLEPNGAMVPVRNFVAHLAPAKDGASGVGTAVLSEIYLPGRVAVFYEVTVAGTSGAPRSAALVGAPANAAPGPQAFVRSNALPRLAMRARAANGATMTGQYEVTGERPDALVATSMMAAGAGEVGISVSTSRFADGELYGAFKPVT